MVLTLLAKHPNGLTRTQMAEATGTARGWAALLGAVTKGPAAAGTLEGDGLVKSAKMEDQAALLYTITAAGKKALAQAAK
jgi:hypothetical protein